MKQSHSTSDTESQVFAASDEDLIRRFEALKGEPYTPAQQTSEVPLTPKTRARTTATEFVDHLFSPENIALQVLGTTQKDELEALKAKLAERATEVDTKRFSQEKLPQIKSFLGSHDGLKDQPQSKIFAWIQQGFELLDAQAPTSVSEETSKNQLLAYAAVLQGIAARELSAAELDSSVLNTATVNETPEEWVFRVLDHAAIEAAIKEKLTTQDEWAAIEACLKKADTVQDFQEYAKEMLALLNMTPPEGWGSIPVDDPKFSAYVTALQSSVQAAIDNVLSEPSRYDVTPMTPVEPLTPASLAPTSDVVEPVLTPAPTSTSVIPTLTTTLSAAPAPELADTWAAEVVEQIKLNQTVLKKLDPASPDSTTITSILSEQPAEDDVGAHRKKTVALLQALKIRRSDFYNATRIELEALGISPPNRTGFFGNWTADETKSHDADSPEGQKIIALSNELSKFVADKLQLQVVETADLVQTPTPTNTTVSGSGDPSNPLVFTSGQTQVNPAPTTPTATVLQSLRDAATTGGSVLGSDQRPPLTFSRPAVQHNTSPASIKSVERIDDQKWNDIKAAAKEALKDTFTTKERDPEGQILVFFRIADIEQKQAVMCLERNPSDQSVQVSSIPGRAQAEELVRLFKATGLSPCVVSSSESVEMTQALFTVLQQEQIPFTFAPRVIEALQNHPKPEFKDLALAYNKYVLEHPEVAKRTQSPRL